MVAVGCVSPPSKKSEIFEDGNWSDFDEPPVGTLDSYAVVVDAGNFYYFGGYDSGATVSSILRLNGATWTWSNAGQLNSARHAHNVIMVDKTVMVIGGGGNQPNEACILTNAEFTCQRLSSSLYEYKYTPLLHLVNDNYGLC